MAEAIRIFGCRMRLARKRPIEYELRAPPLVVMVRRVSATQWCYEVHADDKDPCGGIWSEGFFGSAIECTQALEQWLIAVGAAVSKLRKRKR